ncbi:hypothetical protein ON058_00140 [Demequina sp. B12]|uniref:hypothetical protein n=1 Tax=Demequina sp. B12 TaxID=2992757 RepID=UPI00237A1A45|nr:hypothetical protein [Demequina sp. B12]MDE0571823.1 hypothetical protein [Demequina sp. B12]
MSDLGDALERVAQEPGTRVAAQRDETATVIARTRTARTRRAIQTGVGAVASVAVLAAAGWMLAPEPPLGAMAVADGVVAAVPPLPPELEGMGCDFGALNPYVPWAEPGVTLSSEDVKDLGIEVDATAYLISGLYSEEPEVTPVDRGHVSVDGSIAEHGLREEVLLVEFDVRWSGDALYAVDAAAIMVAQGREISAPSSWAGSAVHDGAFSLSGSPAFEYDAATNTTRHVRTSHSSMETCLTDWNSDSHQYVDGPAQLHTLVQIKDEDGVPLATFVDANGFDGTTVTEVPDDNATPVELTPVEDMELELLQRARSGLRPQASTAAVLRDAVEAYGIPLEPGTVGITTENRQCADLGSRPFEQPLLPFETADTTFHTDGIPEFPSTIAHSTLTARTSGSGTVESSYFDETVDRYEDLYLQYVDSTGVVVAGHQAYYSHSSSGAHWDMQDYGSCRELDGLVAGETYTVIGDTWLQSDSGVPSELRANLPRDLAWSLGMRMVLGDVTIE